MFGMVDDDVSWKANNVVGAIVINNMMMTVVEEMKQRDSIMICRLLTACFPSDFAATRSALAAQRK